MLGKTGGRAPHFTPRDDSTQQNAQANRREGEEYLRVLLQECGVTRLAGEDLGTVPDYVRPSLQSLGIAGFKIPQWEMRQERLTPGHEYEQLCVATYATHDHKPVRALWEEAFEQPTSTSDQARDDLSRIAQFAGFEPSEGTDFDTDFYPAIMEALFHSNAWIAVVMITDLLVAQIDSMFQERPRDKLDASSAKERGRLRTSRDVRERMRVIRRLLETTGARQPDEYREWSFILLICGKE